MKKKLLSLFLISFSILSGQTTKKVYFVGNSYTDSNSLPELIKLMANSSSDELDYDSTLIGGARLYDHTQNPQVTSKIRQGDWDYVVLQEQSQFPSYSDFGAETYMYPRAKELSDLAKDYNPCGNVIFFMTWGYKDGDRSRCSNPDIPNPPAICSYEGMDDLTYQRYMYMAEVNEALISPVGKVWRTIRTERPSMELYVSDGSHPSYLGSMVAAYTFYTVIFKKDPTLVPYNGSLTPTEAEYIKNIVKTTVFDALSTTWYADNDTHSRFTYNVQGTLSAQFTNQTSSATTYLWNFGDGSDSTLENPQHTYAEPGTYDVTLTTDACGTSVSKVKSLNFESLGREDFKIENAIQIFPNPTQNFVNITAKEDIEILTLTDMSGKNIPYYLNEINSGYNIPLEHLPVGIYILKCKIGETQISKKIIKN